MTWHATWRTAVVLFGLLVAAGVCFAAPLVLVILALWEIWT